MIAFLDGLLIAVPVTVVFAFTVPGHPWWTTPLVAFASMQVGTLLSRAAKD